MAGSAHEQFFASDWWWLVKWDVHVYDPRSQTTKTRVMEYPGTAEVDGAAVVSMAALDLGSPADRILAMPHREVGGRYEVRSSTGLEGVFVGKDDAQGYANELRANGARHVTVKPVASPESKQPKKSHAQIKREVDEILRSGPHRGSSGHATKITPRPFYEIEPDDIGKRFLRAFGRGWALSDVLGYVQRGDVGKRLYLVDGILQVENNEQRDARVRKSS